MQDEPSVAGGLIGRPAARSDREFLKLFGIKQELRIPVKQCEEWAEKNYCTAEREEEVLLFILKLVLFFYVQFFQSPSIHICIPFHAK